MNAPGHHSAPQYPVGVGAIAGDIIDSIHEFGPPAPPDVPLFQPHSHITDDTLLTLATAECLATGGDYTQAYRAAYRRHPNQGWGGMFREWARSDSPEPYNSYGNGSAMRVSPVAVWAESEQELLDEAHRSAEVTHNHPEGIKGAQATALAIWLAMRGTPPDGIRKRIEDDFGYDLSRTPEEWATSARFDETCQGTVPPALSLALQAEGFEHTMRMLLGMEGDTDTLCCIAGGVVAGRWGIDDELEGEVGRRLGHLFR